MSSHSEFGNGNEREDLTSQPRCKVTAHQKFERGNFATWKGWKVLIKYLRRIVDRDTPFIRKLIQTMQRHNAKFRTFCEIKCEENRWHHYDAFPGDLMI